MFVTGPAVQSASSYNGKKVNYFLHFDDWKIKGNNFFKFRYSHSYGLFFFLHCNLLNTSWFTIYRFKNKQLANVDWRADTRKSTKVWCIWETKVHCLVKKTLMKDFSKFSQIENFKKFISSSKHLLSAAYLLFLSHEMIYGLVSCWVSVPGT